MSSDVTLKMTADSKKLLREFGNLLSVSEMASAAGSGADIIKAAARRRAPIGPTGRLRRGIIAKIDNKSRKPIAFVTGEYNPFSGEGYAPHAHLVEFGARGGEMPSHPFLQPAARSSLPRAVIKVQGSLMRIIQKKLRKHK